MVTGNLNRNETDQYNTVVEIMNALKRLSILMANKEYLEYKQRTIDFMNTFLPNGMKQYQLNHNNEMLKNGN